MRKVTVAAVQFAMTEDGSNVNIINNFARAEFAVRCAAEKGAKIILLPELFAYPYFCQQRNYDFYKLAETLEESVVVSKMQKLAKQYEVVLPVSFYEKSGNTFFNSVAIIDADGKVLGIYRKTHIPDDHFYQEKFYFSPGDTGFKVWDTKYARIGVGICWDQWFPECARCMALDGAELLFYPTAIGSEPVLKTDSSGHWKRCMQGHAAANIVPVIAANRIGIEKVIPEEENNYQESELKFYGQSFICNETGDILISANSEDAGLVTSEFDLDEIAELRRNWGVFRDRRPDAYGRINSL